MTNLMVKVFNCILMEADIKENSDSERRKVEDSLFGEMEPCTMGNLKMDSCKEKESIIYLMAKLTKGSSGRTKDMVEEHTSHLWELIPEATKETKKKEKVNSLGLMEKCSKEHSIMESQMDKVHY